MNNQDIISTWHWRIIRIGMTAKEFAGKIGIENSSLSHYKSGLQKPKPGQFDLIEGKLKEFEKEKGFA